LLNELAERMEASAFCYAALAGYMADYHQACADLDWPRAEKVRVILIETLEAALDATASVFKKLEPGAKL
jgi:hypothetical protein